MRPQDVKYLLECIRKGNHAIVAAYLRHSFVQGEKEYWKSIKKLKTTEKKMVTKYFEDEETVHYFVSHELPNPAAGAQDSVA